MEHQAFMLVVALLVCSSAARADELVLPCTSQPDCADIEGAQCSLPAGRCECRNGFVLNGDLTRCLAVSGGFDAACEDSIQCAVRMLTGAVCTAKNKCACAEGFHYLHGRCWKSLDLGEACSTSVQCYANFNNEALSCAAGTCACSDGFYLHESGTYCRRLGSEPGDDCFFDFDCKFEGGYCSEDKVCMQTDGTGGAQDLSSYHSADISLLQAAPSPLVDAGAQPAARVGETCAADDACRAADPNSECSSAGTCWCVRGYFAKNGVCARELGEPCELQTDCNHITYGVCRALPPSVGGNICSCNTSYVPGTSNQRCNTLRKGLEFNCQSQMETCQSFGPLCKCVILSDEDIKCRCDESSHFEELAQACWLTKGIGETCSHQNDCLVNSGKENVECAADGTCQCVDSYHNNKGDCLKNSLAFGDECTDDIDCFLPNAACGNGTCVCKSGYFPSSIDDGAIACQTGIGGACSGDGDCSLVEKSWCNTTTSQCQCNEDADSPLVGSDAKDKCLPVVNKYGDSCVEDVQCQAMFGEDISCSDSACLCRENFHFLDQEQTCWQKKELHEKCMSGRDCFVSSGSERTDCINGVCRCQYMYAEDEAAKDCLSGGNELQVALASLVACLVVASML